MLIADGRQEKILTTEKDALQIMQEVIEIAAVSATR